MLRSLYRSWGCQWLAVLALYSLACVTAAGQCQRQADGSWSCPSTQPARPTYLAPALPPIALPPITPPASRNLSRDLPTAMDVRVECPTARGSGTSIARRPEGGTLIVTNYHVIRNQARVVVYSGKGNRAIGRVAMVDRANDLALIAIDAHWPIVRLGNEVILGAMVQLRAFDRGVQFRKYAGRVVREYTEQGAAEAGYFATGASVAGNSGGGVYWQGKLVGVIWGNPQGQTAFVRIGPLRRMLDRLIRRLSGRHRLQQQETQQQGTQPPSFPVPSAQPDRCDCEERWAALQAQLDERLDARLPLPTLPLPTQLPPTLPPPTSNPPGESLQRLASGWSWGKLLATSLGVSGPIGLGIAVAGGLLGVRRSRRKGNSHSTHSMDGLGGPSDEPFHHA